MDRALEGISTTGLVISDPIRGAEIAGRWRSALILSIASAFRLRAHWGRSRREVDPGGGSFDNVLAAVTFRRMPLHDARKPEGLSINTCSVVQRSSV